VTVPENKKEEIRRQLNEEIYPALAEMVKTLGRMPEDDPLRPMFEAGVEEMEARVRIAGVMLSGDKLDRTDDQIVTELVDDKLATELMEEEFEDRDEDDDGSRSE
jgi:hypothetical protein